MQQQMQEVITKKQDEQKMIMEIIENQNKHIQRLDTENKKYKHDFANLSVDEQELHKKMMHIKEIESEGNQMKMLYRNLAAEKAAIHREREMLKLKVEKKKEKVEVTEKQLQDTVKQVNQLRNDNTKLGMMLQQMQQYMPEAKKGELQSEIVFSPHMDEIMRNSMRTSNMRQSVNMDHRNTLNIKKSIRGGAGSMYKKGGNMSVDLGAMNLGGEK